MSLPPPTALASPEVPDLELLESYVIIGALLAFCFNGTPSNGMPLPREPSSSESLESSRIPPLAVTYCLAARLVGQIFFGYESECMSMSSRFPKPLDLKLLFVPSPPFGTLRTEAEIGRPPKLPGSNIKASNAAVFYGMADTYTDITAMPSHTPRLRIATASHAIYFSPSSASGGSLLWLLWLLWQLHEQPAWQE